MLVPFAELIPALLSASFCLLVLAHLPREQTWARMIATGFVFLVTARYMTWRIEDTVLPADGATIQGLWIFGCFVVKALALTDQTIFFLILSRTSNHGEEADRLEATLRALPLDRLPTVDIFIPTLNEDFDVLERTIVGAIGIGYPKFTVWVLDDGGRAWLREYCIAKDVNYIARPEHRGAKGGNINHALTYTTGKFIAVLDADFVPRREFLYRTVGFFEDRRVGCVQTPQHFFNRDPLQSNLHLRDRWPDEQRLFFDVIMASRDGWKAALFCGSCGILRRSALLEIGGMPTNTVTGDIVTTLKMFRPGYVTRYLNERLATGLAAESLESFFIQRRRWCRGGIQTLYLKAGPFEPGLGLIQRLFFIPFHWLVQQPARFLVLIIPIIYLWLGLSPMGEIPLEDVVNYQVPVFVAYILVLRWLAPAAYLPILSTATNVLTAFRLAPTVLASVIFPFSGTFRVTPKGSAVARRRNDRTIFWICVVLIGVTTLGVLVNSTPGLRVVEPAAFFPVSFYWAGLYIILLFLVALMCIEAPRARKEQRFAYDVPAMCRVFGRDTPCQVADLSGAGARLQFAAAAPIAAGAEIGLEVDGVGRLPARVVFVSGHEAGVAFQASGVSAQARLARLLARLGGALEPGPRGTPRRPLGRPALCLTDGATVNVDVVDLSLEGASLAFASSRPPPCGGALVLEIAAADDHPTGRATGRVTLPARVVRDAAKGRVGGVFQGLNDHATAGLDGLLQAAPRRGARGDGDAGWIATRIDARCVTDERALRCRMVDVSASGAFFEFDDGTPTPGAAVTLELPGAGSLDARMARVVGRRVGVRFTYFEDVVRDRLLRRLYTEELTNAIRTARPPGHRPRPAAPRLWLAQTPFDSLRPTPAPQWPLQNLGLGIIVAGHACVGSRLTGHARRW